MKCLVFGSMNIDKVYMLSHLPEKGETLYCSEYELHVGGKGLNQAVSLARAGEDVYMAGCIGGDGEHLKQYLEKAGVDISLVGTLDGFTGHAVIEVDPDGQNQMILFAGANRMIDKDYCDRVLENFSAGDLLLMQYETSQVGYMAEKAHEKGLTVAFNPSPFVSELKKFDYSPIDILILNESEGKSVSGEADNEKAVRKLYSMMGTGKVIMTLGADGVLWYDGNEPVYVPAFRVDAVDTTGAGDTFTGFSLSGILRGGSPREFLGLACAASALAVMHKGAAETIPVRKAAEDFFADEKV